MRYILLFFLLFSKINLTPLSAQIYHIAEEHGKARDSVKRYGIGDTLIVKFDSVYVFNQTQVRYYQLLMNLKVSVTKNNKDLEKLFTELLNSLSMNLAQLEDLTTQMKHNADSTSRVGLHLAEQTLKSVDKTNTLLDASKIMLDSAQAKLTRADQRLDKAEELIRTAKKRQWWERLKWGGGGVLVGILVKSFFFKGK